MSRSPEPQDPVFSPAQQEWIQQLIQANQPPPPPPPAIENTASQVQSASSSSATTTTTATSDTDCLAALNTAWFGLLLVENKVNNNLQT